MENFIAAHSHEEVNTTNISNCNGKWKQPKCKSSYPVMCDNMSFIYQENRIIEKKKNYLYLFGT